MKKCFSNAIATLLVVALLITSGAAYGVNVTPTAGAEQLSKEFDSELAQVQKIYSVLEGKTQADLLIKNVKIVDVFREITVPGTILILDGRIVAIDPDESIVKAKQVVDGKGQYAMPGLIDGHFHFESQLVVPTELSGAMVPHGTTTIIAECCDFVSAAGDDALTAAKTLFQGMEQLPYRIYPFAPGKKVDFETVKSMLDWDFIMGLGEMNNFNFVDGNEEDFKKVAYTRSIGKMLDGHVDASTTHMENFFPAVNIMNDHDIWSGESLENNLKIGLPSFMLYGMDCVTPLVKAIQERKLTTDNIMFSTDNLAVEHMMKVGHMDACLNEAIGVGLDPITAIKMCTYNTAKHFGLEQDIGSITPGRYADIVLSKSLNPIVPTAVYKSGVMMASDGKLTSAANVKLDYSSLEKPSTAGMQGLTEADIKVKPLEISKDGTLARVTVYNYYGYGTPGYYKDEWLPIKDGVITAELNGEKLLNYAIVQRYAAAGQKRIIHTGYLRQFPLNQGALTIAFSAPKPYMISFGTSAVDMLTSIHEADRYNGAYVLASSGKLLSTVPMDIYGMMTDFSASELVSRSESFAKALKDLGHTHDKPVLMSLLELFYLSDRYGLLT